MQNGSPDANKFFLRSRNRRRSDESQSQRHKTHRQIKVYCHAFTVSPIGLAVFLLFRSDGILSRIQNSRSENRTPIHNYREVASLPPSPSLTPSVGLPLSFSSSFSLSPYISFSIFSFNLTISLSPPFLRSSLSHPLLTVFPSFLPPLPFHLRRVLFSLAFSLSFLRRS